MQGGSFETRTEADVQWRAEGPHQHRPTQFTEWRVRAFIKSGWKKELRR